MVDDHEVPAAGKKEALHGSCNTSLTEAAQYIDARRMFRIHWHARVEASTCRVESARSSKGWAAQEEFAAKTGAFAHMKQEEKDAKLLIWVT